MRTKHQLVAATLTAGTMAIAGAGAAVASSTSSSAHTLRFKSKQTSTTEFGPRFVSADKDVKGSHVIGNDIFSAKITYTKKVHKITGNLAVALKEGVIYAKIHGNPDTNTLTGKLTGGAGRYKGVSGTISGNPVKGSNNAEHLIIKYH